MTDIDNCDLLLNGGTVITVDEQRRVIDGGVIAIQNNKILAVGTQSQLSKFNAKREVDCTGKIVTPGFIDCHNHLFQSLLRGVGDGMTLFRWLSTLMLPFADQITLEEALAGIRIGAIEAIRNGTTCIVDHHYAGTDFDTTLAVVNTIESVGLRGVVARGLYGPATDVAKHKNAGFDRLYSHSVEDEIDITTAAIEQYPPGSKIQVWPAPVNVIYNDQELVMRSVELARKMGTRWHTHLSETSDGPEMYLENYGIRPVEWLHREGLLDGGTFAHSIWVDKNEIQYLGEESSGIAHCPVCNSYLGSGVIPLQDLRTAGAVVGLGSDGSKTATQDIMLAMRHSLLLQRVHNLDPTIMTAEIALEMATIEGARYVGIDAGQLAPGNLADIVVLDIETPQTTPLNRAVGTVVYSARGSDVEMTIIDGEIVYERGHCTLIDEAEVMHEAQRRADESFRRLELAHLKIPWRHS